MISLRALVVGMLVVAGCGDGPAGFDLGTADLSEGADLRSGADLADAPPDLAEPLDMTLVCEAAQLLCEGTCIAQDVAHCGGCAAACPAVPQGAPQCVTGVCEVGTCMADRGDCNQLYADGCETATDTHPLHCGGCIGHACVLNNTCVASTCAPVTLALGAPGTQYPFASNARPSAVTAGDFDGDGKLDLFAVSSNSGAAQMLLGDGAGGFAAPLPSSQDQLHALVTGDFNKDGKLDVAAQGYYGAVILIGKGDGTFETGVRYGQNGDGISAWQLVVGDLDADGDLDLVFADYANDGVRVLLNAGNGTFGAPTLVGAGAGANAQTIAVAIGDWNRDGKLDLAAGNTFAGTISILLGNGDGTFTLGTPLTRSSPGHLAVGDLDNDGDLDLVVGSNSSDHGLFLGNGNGTFGAEIPFNGEGGTGGVALGDLNRDGRLDVLITNPVAASDMDGRRSITVFLGTGTSVSPLQYDNTVGAPLGVFAVGVRPESPILVDLDADGLLDIVVVNQNDGDTVDVVLNSTM